jgi:hypothetical protein
MGSYKYVNIVCVGVYGYMSKKKIYEDMSVKLSEKISSWK